MTKLFGNIKVPTYDSAITQLTTTTLNDTYFFIATANGQTYTLPLAASYPNKVYIIYNNAGTGNFTIVPTSPDTIAFFNNTARTTLTINDIYAPSYIISDGASKWWVITYQNF